MMFTENVLHYVRSAEKLLQEAREEIERGDFRQASEKVWGACALAVKAYALARDGLGLKSHRDLWVYKDKIADELGDWVRIVFMLAFSVYVYFYEDLATRRDVEDTLGEVERFVREVSRRIFEVYR